MVLSPAASADDVYKCLTGSGVAYQAAPCGESQVQARLPRLPDYADPPERDGASDRTAATGVAAPPAEAPPAEPIAAASQRGFPFRATIALGMTDDQVLNVPRWGRPGSIVRTRGHHRWHEVWIYARADGVRRLSFTNGRLTDMEMEAEPAEPTQVASLSLR